MPRRRWIVWTLGILVVLVVLATIVAALIDEPMRRAIEQAMNDQLDGYTATIRALDFHPIGFSVELFDVVVVQQKHPDPPVIRLERLAASVHWAALLRGKLVADFTLDRPRVHVDRTHVDKEAEDEVPVDERGWQDALQAVYPLKINRFEVNGGHVTYIEAAGARPVTIQALDIVANEIRNVRSGPGQYPSPLRLDAVVFDTGRLAIRGDADFLRKPHVAVKGRLDLVGVPLDALRPVLARWGVAVTQGTLSASGTTEWAPDVKVAELERVAVDGLRADWVYRPRTAAPAKQAARKTAEAASEVSNDPGMMLRARRVEVNDATVGFVNRQTTPEYRVFLAGTQLVIENVSNHRTEGTATARLTGRFMGSGATTVTAAFRPEVRGPDFDLDVRIENTDMRTMNDLLRAHAGIDVVSGVFSVFSEIRVQNRRVDGYVKPLFRDLDVHARQQDAQKGFFAELKERAADVLGKVLKNEPREEVATVTRISGPLQNPNPSTWQALLNLVRNAFFDAILPGFERQRRARDD
ncbi:MAG TPA: DUF748 domain-containing protein [Candidatus Tectomicrobia bacterium]|nr:DUF748 domain-containing protein [Candidatus Tectomicrobia bacterium]